MKLIPALAALVVIAAPAPAHADQAETTHQASVVHNGQTITLSYEPRIDTRLRQAGIGPRSAPTCFWRSQVSIQRVARDAGGQPIPALTGSLEEGRARNGMRTGLCNTTKISRATAFGGNEAELRRFVVDAASNDSAALRGLLEGASGERRVR